MPWRGVTVSEQRQRFLEDYRLNYYSLTELAERFNISRKTAYKWIGRFESFGKQGFHELSSDIQIDPFATRTFDPPCLMFLALLRGFFHEA